MLSLNSSVFWISLFDTPIQIVIPDQKTPISQHINSELSNIQIGKLIRSLKTCQETTAGNPEQETPLETEEIELDFFETTIVESFRAILCSNFHSSDKPMHFIHESLWKEIIEAWMKASESSFPVV